MVNIGESFLKFVDGTGEVRHNKVHECATPPECPVVNIEISTDRRYQFSHPCRGTDHFAGLAALSHY